MPITITRRLALAGAGGLALAGRARADSPEVANVAFFTETKPTMLAKMQGWFEEGTASRINWQPMGSGTDVNVVVTADACDIGLGIGSAAVAAGIAERLPYQVIGVVDAIGPAEEMTVRASRNIRSPEDFVGKVVATPFGSTSHYRLLAFMKLNGLTREKVTLLDARPPRIAAAWAKGEIDAAYVWSPAKSQLLAQGGVLYPTWQALDQAGYAIADLIVARQGFASSYPDAVTGFLKAYARALAAYRAQPEQAAAAAAGQVGLDPAVTLADMRQYAFVPLDEQVSPDWLGGDAQSPGRIAHMLKATADFMVDQGGIKKVPGADAYQKAMNTDFLSKAIA